MSLTFQEIKKEIRALSLEQRRELASDLIEEISAEDYPVNEQMLGEVSRRMDEYRANGGPTTTLAEIEAKILSKKNRA
jgi:putative addiction module component (TIGR02574 family)